jgi:hypothetical protein
VFLCVVDSGLQRGNTHFARGTFGFRVVCKRWDEVAVGFPRLWVRWTSGAVGAWPLFQARSRDALLFVTLQPGYHWKPVPASGRDILADPTVSRRIRRLDFSGTGNNWSTSSVPSIRPPLQTLCPFGHTPPHMALNKARRIPSHEFSPSLPQTSRNSTSMAFNRTPHPQFSQPPTLPH